MRQGKLYSIFLLMGAFTEYVKEVYSVLNAYGHKKTYFHWRSRYGRRLQQYYNRHVGEDCFIIANGPSLKKTDLMKLKNKHCFALNKAHLIRELAPIEFSYHVCVDDIVLEQILPLLAENIMGCTSFLSLNGILNCGMNPLNADHIEYLYTDAPWSFYKNLSFPISEGYTVTYVALQIAYYMGFDRVFLVGVDHSWKNVSKANDVEKLEGVDQNHFHPDYFKNLNWHLPDLEGNEASYALARHQFHASNRQVLDATIGGKLQVFPKISFEEAVKICRNRQNI